MAREAAPRRAVLSFIITLTGIWITIWIIFPCFLKAFMKVQSFSFQRIWGQFDLRYRHLQRHDLEGKISGCRPIDGSKRSNALMHSLSSWVGPFLKSLQPDLPISFFRRASGSLPNLLIPSETDRYERGLPSRGPFITDMVKAIGKVMKQLRF